MLDHFLEGERKLTYVSKMRCLQSAIDSQIIKMGNETNERKVGLVAFNHEVTAIVDKTENPQIINGNKLKIYYYLLENGIK